MSENDPVNKLTGRTIDSTTDTTQTDSILRGLTRGELFDDRVDRGHEVSHWEAAKIIGRGVAWIRHVKLLFFGKFFFSATLIIPGLFLGWFGKIITDHVILGNELVADEVRFPPHMMPFLRYLEGRDPFDIALIFAVIYLIGLFLIGTRAGGTGAGTYGGRDTASQVENRISGGGSGAGGVVGLAEFWINVRLTQRMANTLRTVLFERMSYLPMTTVEEQRVGDTLVPRSLRCADGCRKRSTT